MDAGTERKVFLLLFQARRSSRDKSRAKAFHGAEITILAMSESLHSDKLRRHGCSSLALDLRILDRTRRANLQPRTRTSSWSKVSSNGSSFGRRQKDLKAPQADRSLPKKPCCQIGTLPQCDGGVGMPAWVTVCFGTGRTSSDSAAWLHPAIAR